MESNNEWKCKRGFKLYHGTSTALGEIEYVLPAMSTGKLREGWRKKQNDVVFLTSSLASAEKYAWKACEKFGGTPIVYEVGLVKDLQHLHDGQYICDAAHVTQRKLLSTYLK